MSDFAFIIIVLVMIIIGFICILCAVWMLCDCICSCINQVAKQDPISPVVVTSATHTAPGDYSVTQMPPPGGYQTNVTVASYPPHQQMQPHMAPYPPMAAQNSAMNPPPYDVAVAGARYPKQSAYEKQAPYNPSYTAQ